MNEQQPNSLGHEDRSEWQRRKTRLQWLMWPSTQRIGKVIRASSYFSTRRVVDLVPEACSTAMTEDRHDELAASNRPQHDRSRSDTVMISMNFNSYASLYFSSFVFFSVLFLKKRSFTHYRSVSCVWFLLPYVNLQSNWAWKPLKLGLSILFYLWGFVSAHVTVT